MPQRLLLQTTVWGFHLSQTGSFVLPSSRLGQHPNAHFHNWTLGSPALDSRDRRSGPRPRRGTTALPSRTPTTNSTRALSSKGAAEQRRLATPSLPAGSA